MNSAIDPRAAAGPKLPLWRTIGLSYSTCIDYFPDMLRISWLWLVIVVPVMVMANMTRGGPPMTPVQIARPLATMVSGHAAGLVMILAGVSIAVAWHRRILLGEHPGLSGSNLVTGSLWRFVGIGLVIALFVLIPVLAVFLLKSLVFPTFSATGAPAQPNAGLVVVFLASALIYLAGCAVMLRLSPLLPARAVGDLGLTFKETWRGTCGHTWRLFWGLVVCTLPPLVLAEIVVMSVARFPDASTIANGAFVGLMTTASTILALFYLLVLPIAIGFLSLAYRHLLARA